MSLTLQWILLLPLIICFYIAVWWLRSCEVDDSQEDTRSHTRRVLAAFRIYDWSALILFAWFFVDLIERTIRAHR